MQLDSDAFERVLQREICLEGPGSCNRPLQRQSLSWFQKIRYRYFRSLAGKAISRSFLLYFYPFLSPTGSYSHVPSLPLPYGLRRGEVKSHAFSET